MHFGWEKRLPKYKKLIITYDSVCWMDWHRLIREYIKEIGWEMYLREHRENIQTGAGRNGKDTRVDRRSIRASEVNQ